MQKKVWVLPVWCFYDFLNFSFWPLRWETGHRLYSWSKIWGFSMSIYSMCHRATMLYLTLLRLLCSIYYTYVAKSLVLSCYKEMLGVKGHSRNKNSTILYVYLKNMQCLSISCLMCHQANLLGLALFIYLRSGFCQNITTKFVRG